MAQLLNLTRHSCERGDLTVFEGILPGALKQIFYITSADERTCGGYRDHKAWQALICTQGRVEVLIETNRQTTHYALTKPNQCLVVAPNEWHVLTNFQNKAIVLVLSTGQYKLADYIQVYAIPPPLLTVD